MTEELVIRLRDEGGGELPSAQAPSVPPSNVPQSDGGGVLPVASDVARQGAAGDVSAVAGTIGTQVTAALGPMGVAATAATVAIGSAAVAARTFANVIETEVDRLSGFSGEVASAQAQTFIEREQALIRRSDQIGADLARAERTRARFESQLTDLNTEILGIMTNIFNQLEPVANVLGSGIEKITELLDGQHGQLLLLAAVFGPNAPLIDALLKWLDAQRGEENQEDGFDPLLKALLNSVGPLDKPVPGVNIPAFAPDDVPANPFP